jgi:hypothetical protein
MSVNIILLDVQGSVLYQWNSQYPVFCNKHNGNHFMEMDRQKRVVLVCYVWLSKDSLFQSYVILVWTSKGPNLCKMMNSFISIMYWYCIYICTPHKWQMCLFFTYQHWPLEQSTCLMKKKFWSLLNIFITKAHNINDSRCQISWVCQLKIDYILWIMLQTAQNVYI